MLNKKRFFVLITFFVLVTIFLLWALSSLFSSRTQTNKPSVTPSPASAIRTEVIKPTPYVPKGAGIYYYNQGKDYVIYDPKYATLEQVKAYLKNPD